MHRQGQYLSKNGYAESISKIHLILPKKKNYVWQNILENQRKKNWKINYYFLNINQIFVFIETE